MLISIYDGIYRISKANYKRLLEDVAAGKAFNLDNYGKYLGTVTENVTDLDSARAKKLLEL